MAGMHFLILKINGVDVSQMPHEEAVQMFLKASEPILVEVRRRSYDIASIENAECKERSLQNEVSNQKLILNSRRQSPTVSQWTSPSKHQKIPTEPQPSSGVDALKLHSLLISSSQSSIALDSSPKNRCELHVNSSGTLPLATKRNSNNSASTSSHYSCNNRILNETCHPESNQTRSASASATTSPTKSVHLPSATSSPFKETKTASQEPVAGKPLTSGRGLTSIGVQTENFATDFIFSGSTMLNSQQMIENEHNLFSECMAPEIDIEEVTLRKSESNERLGLTVCYSSGGGNGSGSDDTDTCTEVYISDIVPDSIAGRDGRLRQGDQILQVNGKDVSNKEETETLIAENNNAVTLLVSRYLYGDDDEFNEQEDFYDEEVPHISYGNCILGNYILSENSPKSGKNSLVSSPEKKLDLVDVLAPSEQPVPVRSVPDIVLPVTQPGTAKSSSSSLRDPLNLQSIRAHLEQVNQEIAILDSRVENMMSQHVKPVKLSEPESVQKSKESNGASITQVMDYDTEHIYETIPEDSESEPFYCSPYETSEHQTRIEQWLGMQHPTDASEFRTRSLQPKPQTMPQNHDNLSIWTKTKNGTVRSTNSSAGDDHENSSSAYNTGGSCNSNTMTPLTLELNTSSRDREQNFTSTLVLCPSKHAISPISESANTHRPPMQEPIDSGKLTHRHSKEKLLSPTDSSKVFQINSTKQKMLPTSQAIDASKSNPQSSSISAANTMYTNVANLQQTMLLQQQLFRQALIHQRVPSNSVPCPQFTAPNLSQYHFVSSQEVSTVQLNTHPKEEHMVWKVKRRQDGTRYIVRRPARNRFLRNRALRISAERNDQTTEDDTISEIKTGRYWTKEERKKHIERARERRQRQQIIITNKNNELSPSVKTCAPPPKNSESAQKNSSEKVPHMNPELFLQQSNQVKNLQTLHTLSSAATAKLYRPTPTGQSNSKKQVKKANNSPVEVSASVSMNPNALGGTGTIKSTTPSGTKMVGLLSVTTV